MRNVTLCFPVKGKPINEIYIGMKKRGFGAGKYNGFGGKVEPGEGIIDAAIREVLEEIGIKTNPSGMIKVAEIEFIFPYREDDKWNQLVHVYFIDKWTGQPKESDEMTVEVFNPSKIPYNKMWQPDKEWLPVVLKDKKIRAKFIFAKDNESVEKYDIKEI